MLSRGACKLNMKGLQGRLAIINGVLRGNCFRADCIGPRVALNTDSSSPSNDQVRHIFVIFGWVLFLHGAYWLTLSQSKLFLVKGLVIVVVACVPCVCGGVNTPCLIIITQSWW